MGLLERLTPSGPKRILSLDGGGIRGTLTLGFLERIERLLRDRHASPALRLCDYFDLIGGTSTGAMIAACLALGMDAAEVRQRYLDLGGRVFGKRKWKQWEARYDARPLAEALAACFGEVALGDPAIRTGLCIVTKRADTSSTWPLLNHPQGRFYGANRHILLRDALRASTAAPGYFVPKRIDLGGGQVGAFLDGGVSTACNPALLLFLVATLRGFPFRWPTGEGRLLLVSVGTGTWHPQADPEKLARGKLWDWAARVPALVLQDTNWHNQLLLQYLSRTPTPWTIDAEVGDLHDDLLGSQPALSYLRYDARLEAEALVGLGLPECAARVESLRQLSAAAGRHDLAKIGDAAAAAQVHPQHFPAAFDLPRPAG